MSAEACWNLEWSSPTCLRRWWRGLRHSDRANRKTINNQYRIGWDMKRKQSWSKMKSDRKKLKCVRKSKIWLKRIESKNMSGYKAGHKLTTKATQDLALSFMLDILTHLSILGQKTIEWLTTLSASLIWPNRGLRALKSWARTIPSYVTVKINRCSKTDWSPERDKRSKLRGFWTCKLNRPLPKSKYRKWRMSQSRNRCLSRPGFVRNKSSKKQGSGEKRLWSTSRTCRS